MGSQAPHRVLVTPRSLTLDPPAELSLLSDAGYELVFSAPGRQPDEADLLRLVPGCVGWLAGVEAVSPRVIEAADSLRAISRNGVGIDNLPLDALERRGVHVLRAEGANSVGVAELAIGLMLAALRRIPAADAGIKSGEWPRFRGAEIAGRTVGILGCGAIGRHVARITGAMGARIVAFDPMRPAFDPGAASFRWGGIDEVIAEADILTLHCPPATDGRPLIDAESLRRMKRRAVIVNTARAALVDETAVLHALESGHLAAFATDVFAQEPPPAGGLASHRHTVATSHIGGFTDESVGKATQLAIENLVAALTGGR